MHEYLRYVYKRYYTYEQKINFNTEEVQVQRLLEKCSQSIKL